MIVWFRRFKRIFKKNEFDQQEDSAADPVQMANELLEDMDGELADLRASLNKQLASEKRLKRRLELAETESNQREEDAIRFLKDEDDQSAKLALMKKEKMDRDIIEITSLYESAQAHKQELLRHIDDQTNDYQRLQTKKNELQLKRNLPPSSSVNEMEITKELDLNMSGANSNSLATNHSVEGEMKGGDQERETSLSSTASVDAKLEALKQSLKKRN
ncbi:PspA/IM30 family protein [Salipaludibacillus sp. HK11]|uniref:PspA/IM30 family protein n=1 Tax=Salipaludibacillus sp. HK11 TaxID=3394320 RepID=UPI0039FCAE91